MSRDAQRPAKAVLVTNPGLFTANEYFGTTLKLEDGELIDMTYTTQLADYAQMDLTPLLECVRQKRFETSLR